MYRDLPQDARKVQQPRGFKSKPLVAGPLVLQVREAKNSNVKKGDAYPLGESIIIGRDELNDIVLKETHVSARHAAITRQGQKWQIRDLGSTNGTFVNGIRICGPVDLSPGDEVRIGSVIFEVRWENAGRGAYSYRTNSSR